MRSNWHKPEEGMDSKKTLVFCCISMNSRARTPDRLRERAESSQELRVYSLSNALPGPLPSSLSLSGLCSSEYVTGKHPQGLWNIAPSALPDPQGPVPHTGWTSGGVSALLLDEIDPFLFRPLCWTQK